jgi:hypothetical protein
MNTPQQYRLVPAISFSNLAVKETRLRHAKRPQSEFNFFLKNKRNLVRYFPAKLTGSWNERGVAERELREQKLICIKPINRHESGLESAFVTPSDRLQSSHGRAQ